MLSFDLVLMMLTWTSHVGEFGDNTLLEEWGQERKVDTRGWVGNTPQSQ